MSRRRRTRIRGTRRRTLVVVDQSRYIAPRVGDVTAKGRTIRRASCGHDVYVGERGLDAIDRRGKRLMCEPCMAAVAGEQGARLGVWWIDDAGDAPAGRNAT